MSVFPHRLLLRASAARPSSTRIAMVDAIAVALLIAASCALAALPAEGHGSPSVLAVGVVLYALARRVTFTVGTGTSSALPLVFVPMWFAASPAMLVLVAIAGQLLAWLPDAARSGDRPGAHLRDALAEAAGAWHAIGPALLMAALGSPVATIDFMPMLAAGAAAQLAAYLIAIRFRALASGVELPPLQARDVASNAAVDLSLAPTGLILAWARGDALWPLLLVVPLVVVLSRFAGERERGVAHAHELADAYRGTAALMGDVLEADDEYTGGEHTNGVVQMAVGVGAALGLDEDEMQRLELGALLHDIGKLRIPNEVINKPGKLNEEEWALIKEHPAHGEEMLQQVGGLLGQVAPIVRAHHERFDGGGYPDGLRAEAIPLEARIITVCDSFSAMTTDRSYRKGMSHADAVAELHRCTPGQFDAAVVDALVASLGETEEPGLRIMAPAHAPYGAPGSVAVEDEDGAETAAVAEPEAQVVYAA